MNTIISHNMKMGIPSITIYAPEAKTIIHSTDIAKHLIQIDGHAEKPFIHCVRFINCVIVAENLRAFDSCYFDESCTMNVKSMPIVNGGQSIGLNFIPQKIKQPKISKEVIDDVKRAEKQAAELAHNIKKEDER